MSSEMIKVNYDSEKPTVSGRDLHEALGVKTPYHIWFSRMCDFGFTEGVDFNSNKNVRVQFEGNREVSREIIDHNLSIIMAKEICMVQRGEKGKAFRQYFIKIEEAWNSPEMVMKRALQFANAKIDALTDTVTKLEPKAKYCDLVLLSTEPMSVSIIAKDYNMTGIAFNKLLHDLHVQYKVGNTWVLYAPYLKKGYTKSNTFVTEKGAVGITTKWTQAGRMFLYNLLKDQIGLLPVVEQAT